MTQATSKEPSKSPAAEGLPVVPVVIDLGKQRKKRVKELRDGKPGKLLHKVTEAVDALRAQNAIAPNAQTIIVVVREKREGRLFNF